MVDASTTFAPSFPVLTHHEEELLNANLNVDFAKVFEDEFFDIFAPEQKQQQYQHQHIQSENIQGSNFISDPFSIPPPVSSTNHQASVPTSFNSQLYQQENQSLVNVMLIVDPITNKVICPPQMLALNHGGDVKNTFFNGNSFTLDQLNQLKQLSEFSLNNTQQFNSFQSPTLMPHYRQLNTSTQTQTPMVFATPCPSTSGLFTSVSTISESENSFCSSFQQAPVPSTMTRMAPPSPSPSSTSTISTAGTSSDMPPLRSLSAYNFFFRDERDRILHGGEHEWTTDKQKRLLAEHWQRDRTKKRRHRKTHGKIDFTTLSKLISQRWKELDESRKSFYRDIAAQDWERYQRELNQYKLQDCNKAATDVVARTVFQPVVG